MWVLLALVCLASPLVAWDYANPEVENLKDGFEFVLPHTPGIKRVFFHYAATKNGEGQIFKHGSALKQGKHWRFHDKEFQAGLSYGDEIQFSATVWTGLGKEEGSVQSWIWAPQAVIHSRPLRQAVIFRDDFNGAFDNSKWHYEVSMFGGFNGEFQVYTPENRNVHTENGHLLIKPTPTIEDPRFNENALHSGHMNLQQLFGRCTNNGNNGCSQTGGAEILPPIMSGKVTSVPTLKQGVLEIRAKIPRGDWLWPAIWMMPSDSKYGGWPRSGEIDIMESRGNTVAGPNGVHAVSTTLHWGSSSGDNHWGQTHGEKQHPGAGWHADFHTWRLEWTADHLATFVDKEQIFRVAPPAGGFHELGHMSANPWTGASKMAPFDQDFFLILNVAVGGTNGFFPDNVNWGVQKPWQNNSPHPKADFWAHRADWQKTWVGDNVALQIDWVEFRHN